MTALIHLLAGVAIGHSIKNAPLVLVAALFSHYLLDRLPHIDPETFTRKDKPYTWLQLGSIFADTLATLLLAFMVFFTQKQWTTLLIGGLSSLLPDLLTPLEKYHFMAPFRRLHELFHWNRRYARQWSWYVVGLLAPLMVAAASTLVLWRTL